MRKNQFLKVKNNLSELQKDFIELKDKELKDREPKIKREVEELFFKPIIVSLDDMNNSLILTITEPKLFTIKIVIKC